MTAPAALTEEQVTNLTIYMTAAGYQAAVTAFGEAAIARFAERRPDCLMLVAADLLDGLPAAAGTGAGGLSSFKLDVLEFKFTAGSAAPSYADLAAGLRARAKADCGSARSARVSANPAPNLEGWGLG